MLYFLHPLKSVCIIFNLFRYITFRSAGASITAFLVSLWLGPLIIEALKQINITQNQQREHAQAIHEFYKHKEKVPTMGGILIVASMMASMLLWGNLTNRFVWILVLSLAWFG